MPRLACVIQVCFPSIMKLVTSVVRELEGNVKMGI